MAERGLAAVAALLFIAIAPHVVAVVLAFVSLLICGTGGWHAVSRRGVVRVIAVVVVVASLAAFGTGVFLAGISAWVSLIVVLGGLSVLAARYALQRTRRQLCADPAHLLQAERPAHPALIMNPNSGGGKAERFHLAEEGRKRVGEPGGGPRRWPSDWLAVQHELSWLARPSRWLRQDVAAGEVAG